MVNDINERIKSLRKAKNVTQKQLCEAIGMKQNAYSQMERFGKRIPFSRIKAIAEYLEVDLEVILGEPTGYDLTPAKPEPIKINDPNKDNPFAVQQDLKVSIGYTNGEISISNLENQILTLYRSLDTKKKKEFVDYLNKLK